MKLHRWLLPALAFGLLGISECGEVDNDGDGYTVSQGDCDDTNAAVYPGAGEFCDMLDNDCDGFVDEDAVDMQVYYADKDGDGFGSDASAIKACAPPAGYSPRGGDCNDANASVYPGAVELCDRVDNDCDGAVDEYCSDSEEYQLCLNTGGTWDPDTCGHYVCGEPLPILCIVPDPGCNCGEGKIFDPELGCVVSDTCTAPVDGDGDGFTPADGDCDDANPSVHPKAIELCDRIDNDCDGVVDELCSDPKEVQLCQDTGGTWDETSCGHYKCGNPPDCDAVIPGCDCGDGRSYSDGSGCVKDSSCTL